MKGYQEQLENNINLKIWLLLKTEYLELENKGGNVDISTKFYFDDIDKIYLKIQEDIINNKVIDIHISRISPTTILRELKSKILLINKINDF